MGLLIDFLRFHSKPKVLILNYTENESFDLSSTQNNLTSLGLNAFIVSATEFNEVLTKIDESADFFANTCLRSFKNSQPSIYGEVIDIYIDIPNSHLFTNLRGKVVLRNDTCDSTYVLGPNLCRNFIELNIVVGDYISICNVSNKVFKTCKDNLETISKNLTGVNNVQETELFSLFQLLSSVRIQPLDDDNEVQETKHRIIVIYGAHLLNSLAKSLINNLPECFPPFILLNCTNSPTFGIHYPSIPLSLLEIHQSSKGDQIELGP